ncbi:MAG: 2-hydroxyacyl-CoA dehydratase family protein [Thermodesulfobacteriota bacterium]|nr:2-hydroxyacyl-CoA dehydratase family protein [Thermodesulfobacteriota bacterium]
MEEYEIFHHAISDPAMVAEQIKEKQRKIIGYLCSYAPEELIYAAGFHPMRLFSSRAEIFHADNHLQSYCCSLVRGVLEESLAGKFDFLYGAVFPHTCDSIQRLSDIWRLNTGYEFFADVVMPVKLNTKSSHDYMAMVLEKFKKDLEKAVGRDITDRDLNDSILKFNKIRAYLKKLYDLRSDNPGIINGSDMHAIVKGSMIMDRDEVLELLAVITAKLETCDTAAVQSASSSPRIVITGSLCDSPDIYKIIEQAGGVVVGDDLCTGQRWFDGQVPFVDDPIQALTLRYVQRIVCPAKHSSNNARGENIVKLAKEKRADGVIFMLLKFCDPHAFDYPCLKEFLDRAKIKNILLEMDDQALGSGQLATRLETFIHMMG